MGEISSLEIRELIHTTVKNGQQPSVGLFAIQAYFSGKVIVLVVRVTADVCNLRCYRSCSKQANSIDGTRSTSEGSNFPHLIVKEHKAASNRNGIYAIVLSNRNATTRYDKINAAVLEHFGHGKCEILKVVYILVEDITSAVSASKLFHILY